MDVDHDDKITGLQSSDALSSSTSSEHTSTSVGSPRCCQCNKLFSSVGNLNKHLKNVHKVTVIPEGKIKCLECHCSFSCKEISSLRYHLMQHHRMNMEIEKIKFHSQKGSYT